MALPLVAARNCKNITVPVSISAENTNLGPLSFETNIDATNFFLGTLAAGRHTSSASNTTVADATKIITVSGTYNLSTVYCEPDSGTPDVLQILTHGFGFDGSYWDFPFHSHNYSYVNFALDHGYATLSWDRLGHAGSSHGDPVREIQLPLEVAALHELTRLARNGSISDIGRPDGFGKVVHVGHSLGSSITNALAVVDPAASDGLMLTGFSHVDDFQPLATTGLHLVQARTIPRFASYPGGYLAQADKVAVHFVFFAPGTFDPEMLDAAFEAGQTLAIGEVATGGYKAMEISQTKAPVLVVTGEHDIVFCGGDCNAPLTPNSTENLLEISRLYFPCTTAFQASIISGGGHGLNLHGPHISSRNYRDADLYLLQDYTWPETYGTITDFLARNGLEQSKHDGVVQQWPFTGKRVEI
ncbi:hypothetical protein JX265_013159 [Neoarthrinium moseri]|uniref:AB hydrolase-1 domain-containing protein n=1 Tax=Neoarthrinium moseri TaxID=1658444 RepID=A0A9P9W8X7_9PEZI|nr:hypothetical protein JX265_013159 [Neoarthrinium moseri]